MILGDTLSATMTEDDLLGEVISLLKQKGSDAFPEIDSLLRKPAYDYEQVAPIIARVMNLEHGQLAAEWLGVILAKNRWHDNRFMPGLILGMFEGAVKISKWSMAQPVETQIGEIIFRMPEINISKGVMQESSLRMISDVFKSRLSTAISRYAQLHDGCRRIRIILRTVHGRASKHWHQLQAENHLVGYTILQLGHYYLNALTEVHGPWLIAETLLYGRDPEE